MTTDALKNQAMGAREPYRAVLKPLLVTLRRQRQALEDSLNKGAAAPKPLTFDALLEPLQACYESLVSYGLIEMARGLLWDTVRRAHCFGPYLIRLDIRQESGRHRSALSAMTQMLEIGDYSEWPEAQRCVVAVRVEQPAAMIPWDSPFDAKDREVLDTFKTIAATPGCIGCQ